MINYQQNIDIKERKIHLLGTHIVLKVFGPFRDSLMDEAVELLHKFNLIFSMYDSNSELFKVNMQASNEKIYLSDDLYSLIKLGYEHSKQKNSMLNILISPLVKAWKIGFNDAKTPNKEEITRALSLTNLDNLVLNDEEKSLIFLEDNMMIDLGALAKGYIADRLIEFFDSNKAMSSLVNLGGNIKCSGLAYHQLDSKFKFGLQNPKSTRGNHLLTLAINDLSIVTSGTYERYFKNDKGKFHHILDPNTGYPIESYMESITVISKSSVMGEIWTSRLFGQDFEYIGEICKNNKEIEVIVIDKENNIFITPGINKHWIRKE